MKSIRIKIKKFWHRIFPKYPDASLWSMADLARTPEDLLILIGENELTPSGLTKDEFRGKIKQFHSCDNEDNQPHVGPEKGK